MATTPPPPVPGDNRDWTFVITDGCAECGFRPVPREELADWFVARAGRWEGPLGRADVAERRDPEVWSTLEYGRHVQDMVTVLGDRVEAMLRKDTPMLADWDGDAKAVELAYWDADPAQTLRGLRDASARVKALLGAVSGDSWERAGLRSDGTSFTVETMSQYIAHEMHHHLADVDA